MKDIIKGMEVTQTKQVTTFPCPICKTPLSSYNDATGYMVYCDQPISICSALENPFGHGKTVKSAHETLIEKWDFATKDRGVKNTKVA